MKKILIIEDDRKIAMGLAVRLKSMGYEVSIAYDAMTGLSTAVKLKPDLLVLDISMPAGTGFGVAEKYQVLTPTATPIIFLTASKQADFRARAAALGAVGFFEKPYEPADLLSTIHETIGC